MEIQNTEYQRLKEEGNKLFNEKKYEEAQKIYKLACDSIEKSSNQNSELKFALYLNVAATALKLKEWDEVIQYCNLILEVEPSNVKALFRRGTAYGGKKLFDLAKIDLAQALMLDSENKEIQKELIEVSQSANSGSQNSQFISLIPNFGDDGQIPRLSFGDPRAFELMKNEFPVILTGLPLIQTAVNKWNLKYLAENITDKNISVYENRTDNQFMYSDESKNEANYNFKSKTKQLQMSFDEFLKKIEEAEASNLNTNYYLQQSLHQEGVNQKILDDFKQFNWPWIHTMQAILDMGPMKANTLWIGMAGVVTPSHFDEAHNFFAQVSGHKKFVLHHPKYFPNMYPFPLHHPCDRQSQVNIENPDLKLFPKYKDARSVEGIVGPSDVLYLPGYWFHYVKSLDRTTSVNFWLRMKSETKDVQLPIKKHSQIMAFRRNIEKFIGETMGPTNVGQFLDEIYTGRFSGPL
jgi:hypoxia-inducible factor 1-alpha inhibitor (HIF hydroxylase)